MQRTAAADAGYVPINALWAISSLLTESLSGEVTAPIVWRAYHTALKKR